MSNTNALCSVRGFILGSISLFFFVAPDCKVGDALYFVLHGGLHDPARHSLDRLLINMHLQLTKALIGGNKVEMSSGCS